jgi:hypothetical protein
MIMIVRNMIREGRKAPVRFGAHMRAELSTLARDLLFTETRLVFTPFQPVTIAS